MAILNKSIDRLVLGALLMLAGCGPKQATGVKIDPALAMLVPSDTVLAVGMRVEALLQTPIYQKHFASLHIPQIDEFARRTAMDPRKELWELLFVSNGKDGVLLGRGKFSDQLEDPRAEKRNPKGSIYKGLTIVGEDPTAVMFVSPSTAAVGSMAALHSLADQREKFNGPPPALAAVMKQIPPEAQFWAAYTGGGVNLALPGNLANVTKILASIQSGSVYFDLRMGLKGVAEGTGSSEESAQQVHDALKALIGFARLSIPKDQPELAQAYDGIRVTLESRHVKLYVDVPQELADRFLNVWLGGRK